MFRNETKKNKNKTLKNERENYDEGARERQHVNQAALHKNTTHYSTLNTLRYTHTHLLHAYIHNI